MSKTKKSLIVVGAILAAIIISASLFLKSLFSEPDMANVPGHYPFKSEKAKEKYLAYYDDRGLEWPVPSESRTVDTPHGITFVRISGPEDAPPLVLLPSTSASSLVWIPNIEALSEHFRVYAVDNIYDFGRSKNTKIIKTSRDMTDWLDELFTALDLGDSINLAGLSFGGWLTSQYTLSHPERLNKAVWIAPAATLFNFPGEWAWRGILSAVPHRHFMKKYMIEWLCADLMSKTDETSVKQLEEMVDDAMMGLKCFRFRMPVTPTVLTDGELRSVGVPTLFVVGENEKLYPAREAVERLNTVAPFIQTVVIPGAGHDLTVVATELVNRAVLEFLTAGAK